MSVTREKLEEIFKVYDDKRNGAIRTEEIGKDECHSRQVDSICKALSELRGHF